MPIEGISHISLKNQQNQMPVPYVLYADFESIIKPTTAKQVIVRNKQMNTKLVDLAIKL